MNEETESENCFDVLIVLLTIKFYSSSF